MRNDCIMTISAKGLCLLMLLLILADCPSVSAEDDQNPLTLEQAVREATAHSYLRSAAAHEAEAARQDRRGAWAELLPRVRANYSYTGLKEEPFNVNSGMEIPISDRDNYHWDVTVIQPLFTGFALTTQLEIRKLTVKVREQEERQAALDAERDVLLACCHLLLAEKIRMVADQTVTALESQEKDSERFFEQELIPLNDLLRSQVALADAVQSRERADASVRLARSRLNLILGRPAENGTRIADIETIPPFEEELAGLAAKALESRPIVKATELGVETLNQAVRAARSAYYPQVGAFASYEQNGDTVTADVNDHNNKHNASIGFQVEWDVFEWGKTRSAVTKSRAQVRAAEERLKYLRDQVRLEVESAFLDLRVARKNIRTAEKTLKQARENQRITQLQYREQVATSTDVLNARTALTGADTNYYQALYGYMTAVAELNRAVGEENRNTN